MKAILFLFALFMVQPVFSGELSDSPNDTDVLLNEIRAQLSTAFEDESVCEALFNKTLPLQHTSTVLKGYLGALYIAKSKHASIFKKLNYFNLGTEYIDKAIILSPNDIELHFLRYTIQVNVPSFLGYSSNMPSDKRFILDNFNAANTQMKTSIQNFVRNCDSFDVEEKALIARG